VRAPKDGVVSDLHVTPGKPVQLGNHIFTIYDENSMPHFTAIMPSADHSRLRRGMELQVALEGYQMRDTAIINYVSPVIMSADEIRATLGPERVGLKQLEGSYVLVTAALPSRKFETERGSYFYRPGAPGKADVRIDSKRLLMTLLPTLGDWWRR